jgi:dnd system-associated protein 4
MADIRIDQSVAAIPEQLAGISNEESDTKPVKLFSNMAEVLVFAALLGASENRSKPVTEPRPNPIRFDVFTNQNLDCYIYLLAIHTDDGFDLLKDEKLDKAIENFESFAFGGLEIISEWVSESGRGLYEAILNQMTTVASDAIKNRESSLPKPKIVIKKKQLSQ